MAYEERDNSGSLFRNTFKEEGSKQPDFTGKGKIDGKRKKISAWVKESASGKKFFSIEFKDEVDEVREPKPGGGDSFGLNDDIPFGPSM